MSMFIPTSTSRARRHFPNSRLSRAVTLVPRGPRATVKAGTFCRNFSQRDRKYVTGFDSIQFPGFSKMHYLELELPETYNAGPLRMIMHGFIEYFSATSGFAAHQAGIEPVVPFLEVQTPTGEWKRVSDDIGFPAGLARTMMRRSRREDAAENLSHSYRNESEYLLGSDPRRSNARRQRESKCKQFRSLKLLCAFADIHVKSRAIPKVIYSTCMKTSVPRAPYARHTGNFTAYGNVLPLLGGADDRFAIIASGDEVALEFDPSSLAPVRPGWSRDYFLYADGFAKDMDFYESLSDTVEPLPFHSMPRYPYGSNTQYPTSPEYLLYRLTYNTRYISGGGFVLSDEVLQPHGRTLKRDLKEMLRTGMTF